MRLSRRDFMRSVGAGAATAGLAGYAARHPSAASASDTAGPKTCYPGGAYSWFYKHLETCCPGEPLAADEMRITFLGSSPIPRLAQEGVSVYVEVGPTHEDPVYHFNVPADYAMFDCGMGVLANYVAAGVPYSRMDKIFIAHLHADHMSELSAIYCFGEASDRKSPLYVWGPSKSGIPDPVTNEVYEDGTQATLEHLREVWRWHTESFSFGQNSYKSFVAPTQADWQTPVPLVPVGKYAQYKEPYYYDPNLGAQFDSYALVPIELPWQEVGTVAYWNQKTGLKITHYPCIHTRRGAISYKVEFTPPNLGVPPITMIYSGDTRPSWTTIDQALGVDVLVHEMVMPPEQWASRTTGIPVQYISDKDKQIAQTIVNSSHTTQGAFGYMLSELTRRGGLPRLTAATHFQAQDETIALAEQSIRAYGIPRDRYTFAADFMMLNVTSDKRKPIRQRRLDVSRFAFAGQGQQTHDDLNEAKYHDDSGIGDPYYQIDNATWIPWTGYPGNPAVTYDENGY